MQSDEGVLVDMPNKDLTIDPRTLERLLVALFLLLLSL